MLNANFPLFFSRHKLLRSKIPLTLAKHITSAQHHCNFSSKPPLKIVETITDIKVGQMSKYSPFLKLLRMKLTQNGVKRYWDFMKLHDSVTVVLYNSTRNVLILVKQFRPPVFVSGALPSGAALTIDHLTIDWNNVPLENGVTLELCGGIIDAKLSDEEIMKNEVYEECGYDVPLKNFERIITYAGAVGVHGNIQTMYYAECTDDMDITRRGETAPEAHLIDVVEMTMADVHEFLKGTSSKPVGGNISFGMLWFLANKAPKGS